MTDGPTRDWSFLEQLRWTADGLLPAIVQDVESNAVLMLAWMDRAALRRTIETGQAHFYSRSRRAPWHKGATSGHVQFVESVHVDCDADVVLVRARQIGGACHEGFFTCFFRRIEPDGTLTVTETRAFQPEDVYPADPGRPAIE